MSKPSPFIEIVDGIVYKQCKDCKEIKDQDCFYKQKKLTGGLSYLCKTCNSIRSASYEENNKEYREAYRKEYNSRLSTKDRHRGFSYKKRYGIDKEEYDKLSESQGHVCKICGNVCDIWPQLSVDHCHSTGGVRGLLCNGCNTGIGGLKESIHNLRNAIAYLEAYNENI